MAETPQANDGDVEKDEITPPASTASIEPQQAAAEANALAGGETPAVEASAPGVAEPEGAPETAVAASPTDIPNTDEPIADASDEPTPEPVAESPAADEVPAEVAEAPTVAEAPAEVAETPVAEEAPAAAVETDETPATEDAPAEPIAEEAPVAPAAEEAPEEAPAAAEVPVAAAEAVEAPAAEEAPAVPAAEQAPAEPAEASTVEEAPVEAVAAPVAEDDSTEAVAEPTAEKAPAAPAAEETPAEVSAAAPIAAAEVVEAPVAEPTAEEAPAASATVAAAETESAPPAETTENFAEMLDAAGTPQAKAGGDVNTGEKVSGVIVKVENENSFVDYGGRGEAVIRTSELKDPKGELLFKVGDPLEAFVVATGDEIQISRGLSRPDAHADVLYQAFKAGMPVEGRIDAVNKWGLGVTIEGDVRGFCPISQLDTKYVENAEEYRGQKLAFKIIEFRHQGRDIVVSRRALLEAEQDKAAGSVRNQLVKGAQFAGKVTRLESFGAFVDLGAGIEGLVHVSEISHQRVGHPQDVLKSGQEIKVQVLRTKDLGKRRKERISLSIKAMEKDPWQEIKSQFPVGTVVEGKVDGLEDFGAFVELAEGVRGLVHVSEIAERRIGHPREVLSLEDQVKVVVLDVDVRRQRLRLSIRQVDTLESAANLKEFRQRQQKEQEEAQSNNAMLDALKRANLID